MMDRPSGHALMVSGRRNDQADGSTGRGGGVYVQQGVYVQHRDLALHGHYWQSDCKSNFDTHLLRHYEGIHDIYIHACTLVGVDFKTFDDDDQDMAMTPLASLKSMGEMVPEDLQR